MKTLLAGAQQSVIAILYAVPEISHEVPGGGHIIIGNDPQGAAFALVAGK